VLGEAVTLGLVGAIVAAADRVGLDVAGFAEPDGCEADGVTHGAADGAVVPGDALPSTPLAPEARPVPPVPAAFAGLLDEPANTSVLTCTKAWRRGGTAASTTATTNTATLMASAGRSIASRQSAGPRCAGRACPGLAPRPGARPGRGEAVPRGAPWLWGALCSPWAPDRRCSRPARKPQPQSTRPPPASGSVAEA
jgi:hypothetical protein